MDTGSAKKVGYFLGYSESYFAHGVIPQYPEQYPKTGLSVKGHKYG